MPAPQIQYPAPVAPAAVVLPQSPAQPAAGAVPRAPAPPVAGSASAATAHVAEQQDAVHQTDTASASHADDRVQVKAMEATLSLINLLVPVLLLAVVLAVVIGRKN